MIRPKHTLLVAATFSLLPSIMSQWSDNTQQMNGGSSHWVRPVECDEVMSRSSSYQSQQPDETLVTVNKDEKEVIMPFHSNVSELHGILLLLGFGVVVVIISLIYTWCAKRVKVSRCHDAVDSSYTADSHISAGLLASSTVARHTWPIHISAATLWTVKYGVSGGMWYAMASTVPLLLFSILSIHFRSKAPGAVTLLQVIERRGGSVAHWMYIVMSLLLHVIIIVSTAKIAIHQLLHIINDVSVEMVCVLLVLLVGCTVMLVGNGVVYYVCYLCTCMIFAVGILLSYRIYHYEGDNYSLEVSDGNARLLGSATKLYDIIQCSESHGSNHDSSSVTFRSIEAAMLAAFGFLSMFGVVFLDQTHWLASASAKPLQGVIGFLLSGLSWFAIPFGLGVTSGLSYLAISATSGDKYHLKDEIPVNDQDNDYNIRGEQQYNGISSGKGNIDQNLIVLVVLHELWGNIGDYMSLALVIAISLSTLTAQVMAISAILINDIYTIYRQPFYRPRPLPGHCPLCAHPQIHISTSDTSRQSLCHCPTTEACPDCLCDPTTCPTHYHYRQHRVRVNRVRVWVNLSLTLLLLPASWAAYRFLTPLLTHWLLTLIAILLSAVVTPILCLLLCSRTPPLALTLSPVGGWLVGLAAWLAYTHFLVDGGLSPFILHTTQLVPSLVGVGAGLVASTLLTVLSTLLTPSRWGWEGMKGEREWEMVRDIDNPLSSWTVRWSRWLGLDASPHLDARPPLTLIHIRYKAARLIAYIATPLVTVFAVLGIGAVMVGAYKKLDRLEFERWCQFAEAWLFVAAAVVVVLPLVQQLALACQYQARRGRARDEVKLRELSDQMKEEQLVRAGGGDVEGDDEDDRNTETFI